jgi:predicted site-specific integrase-resolvase
MTVTVTNGSSGLLPSSCHRSRLKPTATQGRRMMYRQVALYARVSSDRQVEEGTIASQLASLSAYAEAHHHAIDADLIFLDDGFSGATLSRPGLDALRGRVYDRCG